MSPPRLRITLLRRFASTTVSTTFDPHLVGFHVSFNYQMKHQLFLIPTRRETREVTWIWSSLVWTFKNGFTHQQYLLWRTILLEPNILLLRMHN